MIGIVVNVFQICDVSPDLEEYQIDKNGEVYVSPRAAGASPTLSRFKIIL